MINLMYLVFIAMLALNMSKEVLGAFGLMNERLQDTNVKTRNDNELFLASLETKAGENEAKYGLLYQKASRIKQLSEDYYAYLEGLKRQMMEEVKDPQDYQTMDKPDYLDNLFFEGEKLRPGGEEFIEKRIAYRDQVLATLGDDEEYASLRESVQLRFETGDDNGQVENRDGNKLDWLNYHYEGFPLIASLTKLSFTQGDIQNTEQEILKTLLEGQLTSDIAMTNYTTLLEQSKSAFYAGEQFDGRIVLGRKDNSTIPNDVKLTLDGRPLVKDRDYTIEQGRVQLKVNAGNPGDHKIEGNLIFTQDGQDTEVPVSATFATITKPNDAVISAEKMNVVYIGVDNPLNISIPGIADNNVTARAPGLRKRSGSNYTLRVPNNFSGRTISISASGKLPDGKTINTSREFRVKGLPTPQGSILKKNGRFSLPKANLKTAPIVAELEDFDFDLKVRVTSFKIKVGEQRTITVNGSRMNEAAQRAIDRARPGTTANIFEIKAAVVGNPGVNLKPVTDLTVVIGN